MKGRLFLLSCIFIFIFSEKSLSAPCYGTHLPNKKSFIVGIQNYTVLKRYLEKDLGKVRSVQNFIVISYGVWERLSLDLKGGAGNIKQHPPLEDELDYSSSFAGGYGFRLKLYEDKNIRFILGFQHISVHPKKTFKEDKKYQAILDDWQGSFLLSYDFSKITPYIGTKVSRMDYIYKKEGERKRVMSDLSKCFGLVIGVDFNFNKVSWVNLEAQFLDVKAFSLGLNYNF